MHYFCTYFDSNYLLRGLTLYRSLAATGCEFTLYVLALDEAAQSVIDRLKLTNLRSISLTDIEQWEPRLREAKKNRSLVEYYFTLSPLLPLYLFATQKNLESIVYLDADLYFYSSPQPIFDEFSDYSILITEHRYPPYLENKTIYGRFNVQCQAFRRDATAMTCLDRWRDQCIEWCHDRFENGRYADQKYLDEWPELYGDALVVLQHKGGGVAPWNWARYPLQMRDRAIWVEDDPLIFYHFHGLKLFSSFFISNGLADWGIMPWWLQRWFYAGYVRQLNETRQWVRDRIAYDIPLRDRFLRGEGVKLSTLKEVVRKAWLQGMLIIR